VKEKKEKSCPTEERKTPKSYKAKGNLVLQIVKEKILELSKTENHQGKDIITYIDKTYKESFSKYIYFCWIVE
jgi:hypothetical protein